MLRQRAKSFTSYFKQNKSNNQHNSDNVDYTSNAGPYLNMESFLSQDHVRTKNEFLHDLSLSDNENETIFAWNKKTGEWKGVESDSDYEIVDANELPISNFRNCISNMNTMNFKRKSNKDKMNTQEIELDENVSESDSDAPLIAV